MKRGEITAFLSLIFVLLVSFITAMLESTLIQVSKNQKRLDADRAVYSLFGEYDTALLKGYEVLAIEAGYGRDNFEEKTLEDRMRYYGTGEMQHQITAIQYLTDNNGAAFREQVLQYMEHSTGIESVRELVGKTGEWAQQEIQGQEADRSDTEKNTELEELLTEQENTLPAENNPLPHMETLKKTGILGLVLPRDFVLSAQFVELENQVSRRALQSGRGSFPQRTGVGGVEGRLLFHEYLLQKFASALETKEENRNLSYEVEYFIGEKATDSDNLESVLNKLLLIRLGINYIFLQTDTAKQAEAEAMALTLSTVVGMPVATEIVKQVLLAAWAYGESIVDLRSLMSGKKTALVKTTENWQLSLSSLLLLGTKEDAIEGKDTENGLAYKDYLRVLLYLKEEDSLTKSAMDRMEQNLRAEKGRSGIRLDVCVVRVKMQNITKIRDGISYEFPIAFGYE